MKNDETSSTCDDVQPNLAELALGVLTGRERASALSHIQGCPRCREEVEQLSLTADSMLSLAPELDPPAGFEVRFLDQVASASRRRWLPRLPVIRIPAGRRGRLALAGSFAAIALAAAFGLGYAITPAPNVNTASPARIVEATLTSATANRAALGEVYIFGDTPDWLFMSVNGAPSSGYVDCQVSTVSGRKVTVGQFWLSSGSGSWASSLPVARDQLRSAEIVNDKGVVLASARL